MKFCILLLLETFPVVKLAFSLPLEGKVAGFCLTDEVTDAEHPQNTDK